MTESVVLDGIDRGLLHALQLDGRVPFSRVADVLGVSETTVARRYKRLRAVAALRVVGVANGVLFGRTAWTLRLRCTPDVAMPLAKALAKRPDIFWVHVMSGGAEISCHAQLAPGEESILLEKLPRASRVLDVSAHSVLNAFTLPSDWSRLRCLDDDQVASLRPEEPRPARTEVDAADLTLLALLAVDGRASCAELAAQARLSESTVRRRLDLLRHNGVVSYQVDIPAAVLGFGTQARLYLTVPPHALVDVGKRLARHEETSFVAATTGPTNLVAVVACRDSGDLYRYLTERVAPLRAITSLETAVLMRTVKQG
ncbi:Lrp/AsnC family transcriptional regulator [Kutzneria buriramensis]|uniref:DNA-binding Lrp family transcriptional regulator n=1 Tax=Kutzneria buriramensis TaxID=1045776 RepID=A0A3E0H3T0_9PSEU|nr:AsnC family transcriptional regulator [Kutzneria buriramensis]REH37199.1 DNA-binding Lrp family transcriptional regulator [Kutzneria buriramensis]